MQLAFSQDSTLYGCYSNQGSLEVKNDTEFQSRGACRETCVVNEKANGNPGYAVHAMTNGTLCLCSQTLPNEEFKVEDDLCKQTCPGYKEELCKIIHPITLIIAVFFSSFMFLFGHLGCGLTRHIVGGSRLGDYFSVYLTGLDPNPPEDPAPTSSSSSASSTSTG